MVNIRQLTLDDVDHIRQLHEKYYPQFEFPDFFSRFLCRFKIVDSNEKLILAGGVRPIAETIIVTDKEMSRVKIGRALVEAQRASLYACARCQIDELHAFVDNEEYEKHLVQHGFTPRSRALSMRIDLDG